MYVHIWLFVWDFSTMDLNNCSINLQTVFKTPVLGSKIIFRYVPYVQESNYLGTDKIKLRLSFVANM